MTLRKVLSENIVVKPENAGHQHFLRFPLYILPIHQQVLFFHSHLFCPRNAFNLDKFTFVVVN